jgi:hypothetical protein
MWTDRPQLAPSRRQLLHRAAGGFGALALAGILGDVARANPLSADPLAPRAAHFTPRAKNVIFFFAMGGASHVDTFDHKPALYAGHGKSYSNTGQFLTRPQWGFKRHGKSGLEIADIFPQISTCADELAVIRSLTADSPGHDKATLGIHTGSFSFARPSLGSWISYGLGTENRNLPSFVVISPSPPYAGALNWGSDFLPGCHQGTHVIPGPDPVANAKRVLPQNAQAMELDLLGRMNKRHARQRDADAALEARIRSFETAFGMQREAPEAFDCGGESDATLEMYGMKRGADAGFAWQCLTARRLVERGVRFVEVIDFPAGVNWDSHNNMAEHAQLARTVDQPIAALIKDLKQRGMLDETLIVWTTEFGRTPFVGSPTGLGREHHNAVFSSWMAGGGVRGGVAYGTSDEVGAKVAENPVHVHDFHATILHLMGLDHEKLTFRHAGRDFRLTDVEGRVVREILA